jgi:hypothetical protein
MERFDDWPPPAEWEEVVITWDIMLENNRHRPPVIIDWLEKAPGGRYHLHGWKAKEGFAFRFEDPVDALYFKLRWF